MNNTQRRLTEFFTKNGVPVSTIERDSSLFSTSLGPKRGASSSLITIEPDRCLAESSFTLQSQYGIFVSLVESEHRISLLRFQQDQNVVHLPDSDENGSRWLCNYCRIKLGIDVDSMWFCDDHVDIHLDDDEDENVA
ncbi:unnamed protein product [Rotaria magnacalcarata]|uniref:Uncharacterized protein n=1 Tax=Rotaria magnacalcarata TaxID=392030 RepID=A0A820SHE2_9BILA|nr:unnamed protein product [Rotaria magnacalcarata]CAF4453107.1 unnamed protein product [Rotaria magnacalcarata]